jgi:hypothetical protein
MPCGRHVIDLDLVAGPPGSVVERLAPQRVRTNPFVREVVTDLMRRARRDAIGRELRGMAYRMDLATS